MVIAVRPCTNSVQTFINHAMVWIGDRREKGEA